MVAERGLHVPSVSSRSAPAAAALALFLSGAAGLVYQVSWQRAATWVFGVDQYATTTAVACFMLGLALGSWWISSRVHSLPNPARSYAAVETLIALSGLLSLPLLLFLQEFEGGRFVEPTARIAWGFVVCLLMMIVPTILMGTTLPLLTSAVRIERTGAGALTALLYGSNTLGAVIGCLLTGYWLIRDFGVSGSIWVAAALNVAAGVTGLVSRQRAGSRPTQPEPDPASTTEHHLTGNGRKLLVVYGLCGFASLGLEILWIRKSMLLLDYTIQSFSLVLALFLSGSAIGSFAGRFSDGVFPRQTLLTILLLSIALTVMFGAHVYPLLGVLFSPKVAVAAMLALPTLLMGAIFPLVTRCLVDAGQDVGGAVGRVYAANVVGALAGTVVTGFVFLTYLGTWGTEAILVALYGVSAVLAATMIGQTGAAYGASIGAAAATLLVLVSTQHPLANLVAYRRQEVILSAVEGPHGVVTIGRHRAGGPTTMRLNGLEEGTAVDAGDRMALFSHIPVLLHGDPRRVFVVGLGTGNTVSAFLAHPEVEVNVAELAHEVVMGARDLVSPELDYFRNPRFHLYVTDGRQALQRSTEKYDLIMSGTRSHLYMSGNLYSAEVLAHVRQPPDPGGPSHSVAAGSQPGS